ncbi:MAG: hypothetical protein HFE80_05245 [Clostridiaceae bacterium]|jgi:hypothetical protein|nr:hypothetical protein [Clostridiaceae bacterium]
MSLGTENGLSVADIAAVTDRNNCNNGGYGFGGGFGEMLIAMIMLFLFPMFFGGGMFGGGMWGGMGGWGNGGMMAAANGALTRADLCSEFNFNGLENAVRGVQQGLCDGFYAMQNSINGLGTTVMQGFHGVDNAICNLGYQTQQGFNAMQTAYMQGQNALQAQLAQCCCDNRVGQMQIMNQMGADTCAVTNVIQNTARDGIDNQNRNHQALMDKLCQMEYNGLNDKYQAALAENQALKFQVSQTAQNSAIGAMISASEATILRRTGAECPVNAYVVQPPTPVTFPTNCCGQANYAGNYNGGCGCGNNAAGCC